MLGRNIEVLIPADRRDQEHSNLARAATGELVSPYESERLRSDGSATAMSVTMSPLADANGTIVGISTVARELSERQQADARFSGLLEATPLATICVDRAGTIILTNTAAETLFGYRRDQLIGQSVDMLVPDSVHAADDELRDVDAIDLEPRSMGAGAMFLGRRSDGTEFPAEISLSSLRDGDDVTILATVRDITERLAEQAEAERLRGEAQRGRLERLVQQSQRLDSIGQLAGGVAHDFNNLLGVILNYTAFACAELARADADDPSEPWAATRSDLEQVVAAAQRAARLTRQLLTFARGEVTHPEVLDLNTVVTGVEELLTRTIGEHIVLSFELAPRVPPVSADRGLLEQRS
jgi:PAS domain S-box-containing protein